MIDFVKKVLFWLWNPKMVRCSKGRIIDDRKRRKHSKSIQKKIDIGEIMLKGQDGNPRNYKVITKGKVVLKRRKQ